LKTLEITEDLPLHLRPHPEAPKEHFKAELV